MRATALLSHVLRGHALCGRGKSKIRMHLLVQGAALAGGPSMAYREPVAALPGAATVAAAQGRDKSMPAMRKL